MNGIDNRASLLNAAASISDGETVDWHTLRRTAAGEDTAVLDQLRVLDDIAQTHRNDQGTRRGESNAGGVDGASQPRNESRRDRP